MLNKLFGDSKKKKFFKFVLRHDDDDPYPEYEVFCMTENEARKRKRRLKDVMGIPSVTYTEITKDEANRIVNSND